MERLMQEITKWSKIYELNFQFWPEQCSCYISKDGVELKCIGGNLEVRQVIEYTCQYLRKINPK